MTTRKPASDPSTRRLGDPARWDVLAAKPWRQFVRRDLEIYNTHTGDEIQHCVDLATELDDLINRYPGQRAVEQFLAEPTTWFDRLDRWAVLLTIEHILDLPIDRDRWPGWTPPPAKARPLRPLELGLTRLVAYLNEHELSALVGLAEAGADSGEFALTFDHHLVRAGSGDPYEVNFPGEAPQPRGGPSPASARTATLPKWCRSSIRIVLDLPGRDRAKPALYRGTKEQPNVVQSAMLMRLKNLRWDCGLRHDTTVQPQSIRNGVARQRYDESGIEAVGEYLGLSDLNACRSHIGFAPAGP